MITLGILGGVASGKSTLTQYLIFKGACHLDGDKINHEILTYPEVVQQVKARWSSNCLKSGLNIYGQTAMVVDRKALASIVFNDPNELRILEDIVWPLANAKLHESFTRYNQEYTKVLIFDIPMLIETGWINLCNKTVFVSCPEHVRIERFAKRQGYTLEEGEKQLKAREARQIDLNQKREFADIVVEETQDYTGMNLSVAKKLGLA